MDELKDKISDFKIDCVFVDGNGILHSRECGLATHLGVLINTPTVGCAKTLFSIDGIKKYDVLKEIKEEFKNLKDQTAHRLLKGVSGKIWGVAMKNTKDSFVPLIVSVGHLVSIEKAIELVYKYSIRRVIEPIRLADKQSRFLMGKLDKYLDKNKNLSIEDIIKDFKV